MPEYICSSCGCSIETDAEQRGKITCSKCGEILSVEDLQQALPVGTRVGGYEIIRHLATGGTGSVYLAEQISMERKVALKILNADQVSSGNAERFLNEARNTAKFENPHVVSVIDTGISEDGYYYIAMQYVEGETLEEILQRGRVFSEEETLIIGMTVADALRMVWLKYKLFHKDIKPGNIMLTPENEAMILDMGAAQERGASRLEDGNVEGSPYYMSPEQARGEELSWSSDLYSLGATMYQMVTGKYLYEAENVDAILLQHDSAPFPDPAVRAPEMKISKEMTELLRKMLEKKPGERYSSWEEFIRAAKKLLKRRMAREGSSQSKKLQQKYLEIGRSDELSEQKTKARTVPSPGRFICYSLLIFIFSAALLGGVFLYLAVRKNSSNAEKLLVPIQKQVNSLQMDPDAAEELIRQSEPYFNRLGVLPSLRRDFEKCRQKVAAFRELSKSEGTRIIQLETLAAEQLQAADQEMEKAKAAKTPAEAMPLFARSDKILRGMIDQVGKKPFALLPNIERADALQKRLKTARQTVYRERHQFWQMHIQSKRKAAGSGVRTRRPLRGARRRNAGTDAKSKHAAAPAAQVIIIPPKVKMEKEKNRVRVFLLEQQRKGELISMPALQLKPEDLPPDCQLSFAQWLKGMQSVVDDTLKIRAIIYDSRQTFSGFKFTVMTQNGYARMELRTILRDNVILFRRGMPNVRLHFNQLANAEWLDFLRQAAKRKELSKELDSYLLLDGWFRLVEKSRNAFVRKEMPRMRKVYYDYLIGEKIEGLAPLTDNIDYEIIRKNASDPFFAPYRAKLKHRE